MGAPFKKVLHPTMCPWKRRHIEFLDFSDLISYPDGGVWEADGPTIWGVQVWDVLGASLNLTDTAQLVLSLGGGDAVHDEPALHVIDDIHEPGGEPGVGPELAIDLDDLVVL